MNLREFTEYVDKQTENLERQELVDLIHGIVRKIPEGQRQEFLEILGDIRAKNYTEEEKKTKKYTVNKRDQKEKQKEIQKELDRLTALFEQIQEEELHLCAEGYEDYSSGYWDSDWIWEYKDEDGIGRIYEDSARLIQRCINDGCYNEVVRLFDIMMETEILVSNDWDEFCIGFEDLQREKLASIDFNNLSLCILYAVYQTTQPDQRAETLYDYFSISYFKEIRMEQMLSLGREELEGLPQFWDAWIALLSDISGDLPAKLLKEAVEYQRGNGGMLEAARTAFRNHPSLYLEALKNPDICHEYHKQMEIGMEALNKIGKQYRYRSRIAIKTAEAAIMMNDEEQAEKCWMEAFVSDTTPVNYLRILNECRNPDIYRQLTANAIHGVQHGINNGAGGKELELNVISMNDYAMLKFLDGDFDYAMNVCMAVKGALGWTGTFIKSGIALFLLLLSEDDQWKQGCLDMEDYLISEMRFTTAEYFQGTKKQAEYGTAAVKEREVFHDCFLDWKKGQHLSEEQEQRYLSCLERLIDKRVKAIVSGQYRNYYKSAAALAAALGEVMESRGEAGGKQNMLMKYKKQFPRHSSFCGSLRGYGMRDKK